MTQDKSPAVSNAVLQAQAAEGCPQSKLRLSRRAMLGMTAGLFSSAFLPRFASAASSDPRLLVVVLRGGMDGINTVVPLGDPAYASMRGGIALTKSNTLAMTSFFRLNPALPTFASMFAAGEAAAVHATCVPLHNRSHFDCQDNLENGLPGLGSNSTGWLNRLLTALPSGDPIVSHGAIQIGEAPLILRGQAPVLGWSPTWFEHASKEITDKVVDLYRSTDPLLHGALVSGLKADALVESNAGNDDGMSSFRRAFRAAGRLMRSSLGPRIAVLSVDNFDTHAGQGTAGGFLAGSLSELDTALDDFKSQSGDDAWAQTVVVMATEFGRTVHVNGTLGTDHGVGSVALLAGGAVNGGAVLGDWPGISQNKLFEGSDLTPTTDLRAVFKGILADHLGVPNALLNNTIFPESASVAPMSGLVRSPRTALLGKSGLRSAALRPASGIAAYRARYDSPA